ncbi:MAG: IclR family transcriptional regulator C-terminal domain-containing protein [Arhodomonas sp.]|nr:IclR family transcriptional regulator C-terminal domain-containing protein [Arhodomonas sp.]
MTDNTLDTPARLLADLAEIRERGYACDYEEHAVGLRCVAATIHDETGQALAAISVSGPRARITDAVMHELGAKVARTARAITGRLGGVTTQNRASRA